MAQVSGLGAIVERIQGAGLDPAGWSGVLSSIADLCGARTGIIYEFDAVRRTSTILGSPGIDEGLAREYEQHYSALDPWHQHAMRGQIGRIALTHEIIPDAQFERSEFYQDHVRRVGIFYSLGLVVERSAERLVVFGVQRGYGDGPFRRDTADIVEHFLVSHLRQTYLVQREIRAAKRMCATFAETLHLMPGPVLVVDGAGTLHFANRAAEAVFAAGDGLRLKNGIVTPSAREQAKLFADTLARLARGAESRQAPVQDLAVRRPSSDRPLLLRFAVLPRSDGGETPRIAILVDLAAGAARSLAHVGQALRLTGAEIRLLGGLVAGESLAAFSDKHGVSVNTLRVQLRGLFQKTGTHRQAELVRFAMAAMTREPRDL